MKNKMPLIIGAVVVIAAAFSSCKEEIKLPKKVVIALSL